MLKVVRNPGPVVAAVVLAMLGGLPGEGAFAGTIIEYGVSGLPGADGVNGDPGTDGTAGTDGDPVTAEAITVGTDSFNEAQAFGGYGGSGGRGGNGVDGPDAGFGAQGGAGGDGGVALSATANAGTTVAAGAAYAKARAYGGRGGDGGDGGYSLTEQGFIGTPGPTGTPGASGDAVATAFSSGVNQAGADAGAFGGDGGLLGPSTGNRAAGGNASAVVTASASAPDGDAQATVDATGTGSSNVSGSVSAGRNAYLSATVRGATVTTGELFAESRTGGTASASLLATGNAVRGDGPSVVLLNQVDGFSSGSLYLGQTAKGGDGTQSFGGFAPGRGGNAVSVLFKAATAEQLTVTTRAEGGRSGEANDALAAAGGDAHAGVVAENSGSISISASAIGGDGGSSFGFSGGAGDGGVATLGTVSGISTAGGNVLVSGNLTGGRGGTASYGSGGAGVDAVLVNAVSGETSGRLELSQQAVAGNGGGGYNGVGGRGGHALAELARSGAFESLVVGNTAQGGVSACGSMGGTDGGNARASSMALNATGDASASAAAFGGVSCAGNAGLATAGARAIGAGAVEVRAGVVAANGGSGKNGGSFFLEDVYGESTGGGDTSVFLSVGGGDGGAASNTGPGGSGTSVILDNAADGKTTGELRLFQQAYAGKGGSGTSAGLAGNASSTLSKTGDFASLALWVDARGGEGGYRSAFGGNPQPIADGGTGTGAVTGIASGDVSLQVTAIGGTGGGVRAFGTGSAIGLTTGSGGVGGLGTVWGESTGGGAVTVTANVVGGRGGEADDLANSGNGASVSLVDAIDGETDGVLTLIQNANGGSAGSVEHGLAGTAGNATSWLTRAGSFAGLNLEATVFGGSGACRTAGASSGGTGGDADAQLRATNDTGDVGVRATAFGGAGGCGGGSAGHTRLAASGSGVGAVTVSVAGYGATGGAGLAGSQSSAADGARGGTVETGPVFGMSTGNGPVQVAAAVMGGEGGYSAYDGGAGGDGAAVRLDNVVSGATGGAMELRQRAVGGSAGQVFGTGGANGVAGEAVSTLTRSGAFTSLLLEAIAEGGHGSLRNAPGAVANGAVANASIDADNHGGSAAAFAYATGGAGGFSNANYTQGTGGDATASAVATGSTSAEAMARAVGGGYRFNLGRGTASADATGHGTGQLVDAGAESEGSSGSAVARSTVSAGIFRKLTAEAATALTGDSMTPVIGHAGARVTVGDESGAADPDPFRATFDQEAFAALLGRPSAPSLALALEGNSAVADRLADGGSPLMLGQFQAAFGLHVPGQDNGEPSAASGTVTSAFLAQVDFGPAAPDHNVVIGLLNPVVKNGGFDTLRFRVLSAGIAVLDEEFFDVLAAVAYFDDHAVDLGVLTGDAEGLLDLRAQLDFTGSSVGDGFGFKFIVQASPVPLPASGVLLLVAVGSLLPRLRRRPL